MPWQIPGSSITCDLGVGCNETGICYAMAHGQPDQCGVTIVDGIDLSQIKPFTEKEAEELFERTRAVTDEECEAALAGLAPEASAVVRRYIAHLRQRLRREQEKSNRLSHEVAIARDPRGGNY